MYSKIKATVSVTATMISQKTPYSATLHRAVLRVQTMELDRCLIRSENKADKVKK